jgi:hypothetical protein
MVHSRICSGSRWLVASQTSSQCQTDHGQPISHQVRQIASCGDQIQAVADQGARDQTQAVENAKVQCELDTLKLKHTREVYLLRKEIENLKDINRLQAKSYRGNTLSTALSLLAISEE